MEGAESPRAEEQRVDDVKKEQLIIQEEEEGDEKKDEEKAVPSDDQPPEVTWTVLSFFHMSSYTAKDYSNSPTANFSLGIYPCLFKLVNEKVNFDQISFLTGRGSAWRAGSGGGESS